MAAQARRARAGEHDSKGGSVALEWASHPIRHAHDKTVILVGVVSLATLGVYLATGSLGWAGLSLFLLLASVYDYLCPTVYRLDERGVTARTLFFRRRRAWHEVRSLHRDPRGVLVSPFLRASRLDTFRGLYLRFDDNAEEVMAFLRRALPETPR